MSLAEHLDVANEQYDGPVQAGNELVSFLWWRVQEKAADPRRWDPLRVEIRQMMEELELITIDPVTGEVKPGPLTTSEKLREGWLETSRRLPIALAYDLPDGLHWTGERTKDIYHGPLSDKQRARKLAAELEREEHGLSLLDVELILTEALVRAGEVFAEMPGMRVVDAMGPLGREILIQREFGDLFSTITLRKYDEIYDGEPTGRVAIRMMIDRRINVTRHSQGIIDWYSDDHSRVSVKSMNESIRHQEYEISLQNIPADIARVLYVNLVTAEELQGRLRQRHLAREQDGA